MNQPPAATTQNFHTLSMDVHPRIIDSALLSLHRRYIFKGAQRGTIGELGQGPYLTSHQAIHITIVTMPCKQYVSKVTVDFDSSTIRPQELHILLANTYPSPIPET